MCLPPVLIPTLNRYPYALNNVPHSGHIQTPILKSCRGVLSVVLILSEIDKNLFLKTQFSVKKSLFILKIRSHTFVMFAHHDGITSESSQLVMGEHGGCRNPRKVVL